MQEPSRSEPSKGGAGKLVAVIVVIAAVAGGAYYNYAQSPAPIVAEASAKAIDLSTLNIDPEATRPALGRPNFEVLGESANASVKVTGPLNLYSSDAIPVDVEKKYELRVRLRVLPGPDGAVRSTRLYAGISTYDSVGAVQLTPLGDHRYAVLNNATISSEEGWVERSAIVTGVIMYMCLVLSR